MDRCTCLGIALVQHEIRIFRKRWQVVVLGSGRRAAGANGVGEDPLRWRTAATTAEEELVLHVDIDRRVVVASAGVMV